MSNLTPYRTKAAGFVLNTTSTTAPSLTDPSLNNEFKNQVVTLPDGTKYFVDASGKAVELGSGGSSAPATQNLPVAMAIGTQAQLDSIPVADRVTGAYYIHNDAASSAPTRGDILVWADTNEDGVGDTWEVATVPKEGQQWVVLTNASGVDAGTYTYALASDQWTRSGDVPAPKIPDPDTSPAVVGGIKFPHEADRLEEDVNGGAYFIMGDDIAAFGLSYNYVANDGVPSNIYGASNASVHSGNLRLGSYSYHENVPPFAQIANYDPSFIDVQTAKIGSVAIDALGNLWATGEANWMYGLTGTNTVAGKQTSCTGGYMPLRFFHNTARKAKKMFAGEAGGTTSLMVLTTDNELWVSGSSDFQIYGDSATASAKDYKWHKPALPAGTIQDFGMSPLGNAAWALVDGVFYGWGYNIYNCFREGLASARLLPATTAGFPSGITSVAFNGENTVVIAGGARYGIGRNLNGALGNGNTNPVITGTALPSNGFTYEKVFRAQNNSGDCFVYITTDKRAVFTGKGNSRVGTQGQTLSANLPNLMGNGPYQGSVIGIRTYINVCYIHTNQGEVWTAANTGAQSTVPGWNPAGTALTVATADTFRKVPIRGLVYAIHTTQTSGITGYSNQATVLVEGGDVYTWGTNNHHTPLSASGLPVRVPVEMHKRGTVKSLTV